MFSVVLIGAKRVEKDLCRLVREQSVRYMLAGNYL